MKNLISRYWNFEALGIFKSIMLISNVLFKSIYERISLFFWKFNLKDCGKGVKIQKGAILRYPKNIIFQNNVLIGRNVEIFTEFENSILNIGVSSEINKNVQLDYSGELIIGKNVVISENSTILSHDHGLDPHSLPIRKKKTIHDNVWVGQNVLILAQAQEIGENSIIAAGSVVTKNVPANVIVGGNPAKLIRQL
jgi:acetyltransferase-like isoleucine patch superfamily enzyme